VSLTGKPVGKPDIGRLLILKIPTITKISI